MRYVMTSEKMRRLQGLLPVEVERMMHIYACGPCSPKPIDIGLLNRGWLQQYDDTEAFVAKVPSKFFYQRNGTPRPWVTRNRPPARSTYMLGHEAAMYGALLHECPYNQGTLEATNWCAGWHDAQ